MCAVCSEANDDMILTADVVANLLAQKECSINNTQAEDDERNDENDESGDEGNSDNLHAPGEQQQHEAIQEKNSGHNENRETNENTSVTDNITNAACRASSEEMKKEQRCYEIV